MPPKRSRYEIDEYIPAAYKPTPAANNPTDGSQSITQRHTQYEMSDALRTSRVKTVLNVEHEAEPTTLADAAMVAEVADNIPPELIQVDYDSDDEEADDLDDNIDRELEAADIDRELEAAGLGEIHAPEPTVIQSRHIRKTHTVSRTLSHPLVLFSLHV